MFEPIRLLMVEGNAEAAIALGKRYPETLVEGPGGSSKSRGVQEYINSLAEIFPGIRVLLCRQTLSSLRQSIQVTLEDEVWYPEHPCLRNSGASREHRVSYKYPKSTNVVGGVTYTGESEIVLVGLESPERTFSAQYDVIVVEEGIEITEKAWELLLRANRNNKMPWQQMIAVTNPGSAFHWLNRRPERIDEETGDPVMRRLLSRHTDNPIYWDQGAKDWTEIGKDYVKTKLSHMTGATRERLLHGRWVSESGLIYEAWDDAVHVVDGCVEAVDERLFVKEGGHTHEILWTISSQDFGYRNPGSLSVYGIDKDGYWWHLEQAYHTEKLESWWADQFAAFYKKYSLRAAQADPAEPGMIKAMNVRVGRTDANPLVRKADNDFKSGRDCVAQLLEVDDKGIPGIRFLRHNLSHPVDTSLRAAGKPTCTREEMPSYIWDETKDGKPDKEQPRKENDHGADELRYFSRHLLSNDYARKDPPKKFAPGSYGDVLGHNRKGKKRGTRPIRNP